MNFRYLTAETLEAFRRRYPAAAAFLRRQALAEERAQLAAELESEALDRRRRDWIENRLAELGQDAML